MIHRHPGTGKAVEFPDDTPIEVVNEYLRTMPTPEVAPVDYKLGFGDRMVGLLSEGAANLLEDVENVSSNLPYDKLAKDIETLTGHKEPEQPVFGLKDALRTNRYARGVTEQPATSFVGGLAEGLVQFAPQIPEYTIGGGGPLKLAAGGRGMLATGAKWLTTKSPSWLANYGKAIPRAFVEGLTVGGVAGSPADTPIIEKTKKGLAEGTEFAAATAVLHPVFKGIGITSKAADAGIGKIYKGILRRLGKNASPERVEAELAKRAETSAEAKTELEALQREKELQKEAASEKVEEKVEDTREEIPEEERLFVPDEVEEVETIKEVSNDKKNRRRISSSKREREAIIEAESNVEGSETKVGRDGDAETYGEKKEEIVAEEPTSVQKSDIDVDTEGAKIKADLDKLLEETRSMREAVGKLREGKTEKPTETMKEDALDRLETEEENIDIKAPDIEKLRDIKNLDEPVANDLLDAIPITPEQLKVRAIREGIRRRAVEKEARKIKEERKAEADKLQEEFDALLEEEGLGEIESLDKKIEVESLSSSFKEEEYIKGLNFSDSVTNFFDDIIDGVYKEDGETLDSLGLQQIYERLTPLLAKGAKAVYLTSKFIYMEGKKTFPEFVAKLKEIAGDTWNSIRRYARKAFNKAKEWNDKLGERGSFSTKIRKEDTTVGFMGTQYLDAWIKKLIKDRKAVRKAPSEGLIAESNGSTLTSVDVATSSDRMTRVIIDNIKMFGKMHLGTPEFAWIDNDRLFPLLFGTHKAMLEGMHYASARNRAIRAVGSTLSKEERLELRQVLEGKVEARTPAMREASDTVRKELDAVRAKYQAYMRKQMMDNLSKSEFAVISKVLAGETIENAIANHGAVDSMGRKIKYKPDVEAIEDILEQYHAVEKWGFDNYYPHWERGSMRIVDTKGNLVAKAVSIEDAARKFVALADKYPNQQFMLDTAHLAGEIEYGIDARAKRSIARAAEKGIEEVLEAVEAAASRRSSKKVKISLTHSPFTFARTGRLEGEADPFDVLLYYMHSMEKKMALDPWIEQTRRAMRRTKVVGKTEYVDGDGEIQTREIRRPYLTDKEQEYLTSYINDIKGRASKLDKHIDSILGGYVRPRAYSRFVSGARTIEANLKFAYRPVAGFINGLSGLEHLWTKTSIGQIKGAAEFLRTEEGKKFILDMEPYFGVSVAEGAAGQVTSVGLFDRWGRFRAPKTKAGEIARKAVDPMVYFQAPELPMRKLSMAAFYLQGKAAGLSEMAARDQAILGTWFTQYSYDIASLPDIMRSPTGRLITQFKPYLVKEIEFISSLSGKEWGKYATMFLSLGGLRGAVTLLKSLPIIGMSYGLSNVEDWLNENAPRLSRGIGGYLGVDVTAAATFQLPNKPLEWLGMTVTDIANIWVNILKPFGENIINFYAKDTPTVEWKKAAGKAIPIFRHYANLFDQIVTKDGWVKNEDGTRLWQIDNMSTFALKSVMGAKPLGQSRVETFKWNESQRKAREALTRSRTIENIAKADKEGKPISDKDLENMVRFGIPLTSITNRELMLEATQRYNLIKQADKYARERINSRFPDKPAGWF